MVKNPLLIPKAKQYDLKRPENQSAGILEDHNVSKVEQTKEIYTNSIQVDNLTASKVVVTDANKQLATSGDATFTGLFTIDQNADAKSLDIDSEATTSTSYGILVTTGQGARPAYFKDTVNSYSYIGTGNDASGSFYVYRNLDAANTSSPVAKIVQDNASDDQNALNIQQDGTGYGITVDTNNNTRGIHIDKDVTNSNSTSYGLIIQDTSVVNDAATYTKTGTTLAISSNVTETSGTITDSSQVLTVENTHADATGAVAEINNDGTGHGLWIHQDGVSASNKAALYVYSNAAQVTSHLVYMTQDNASSDKNVIQLQNDGTGNGVFIDQNGNGVALNIDSESTDNRSINVTHAGTNADGARLTIEGNLANGKYGFITYSDAAQTGNGALMTSFQDNASASQTVFLSRNDGTGAALYIDNNSTGDALVVDGGDHYYVGAGSGLPYGAMYGDDVSITINITSSGTYTAMGAGLTAGELNLVTHSNSTLTVAKAGRYLVNWSASVNCGTPNQKISMAVMVNSTAKPETEGSTKILTGTDDQAISGTGILSLAANDVVKFCGENETSDADLVVSHANMSLVQIGG